MINHYCGLHYDQIIDCEKYVYHNAIYIDLIFKFVYWLIILL